MKNKLAFIALAAAPACACGSMPRTTDVPAPTAVVTPAPPASRESADELFAAIKAKDVAKIESLLAADARLASAHDGKGRSAVLVALFVMKDKESFLPAQENRILSALLARQPALDRFEVAAVGDAARVGAEIDKDAAYVRAMHDLGWTPLHFAAFGGNAPVAELLVARGADINGRAKNKFANTPLQVSLLSSQEAVARLLVAKGADVTIAQDEGFTALHEASQAGNTALVALFLDHGADIEAKSAKGTPLAVALEAHRDDVAALLRKRGAREP